MSKKLEFEIEAPQADSIIGKMQEMDSVIIQVADSMQTTEQNMGAVETSADSVARAVESGFSSVLGILGGVKDKLGEVDDAAKTAATAAVAGGKRSTAAMQKFGSAVLRSVVALASAVVALKRMATESPFFAAATDRINDSLSDFALILGDAIAPIFEVIADFLDQLVDLWDNLSDPVKNAITLGIQVATVLGLVAIAFGILSGAMALPAAVLLIIVGAVALLALAWEENFLGIQDITASVIGFIQPLLDGFAQFIGAFMVDPVQALMDLFANLSGFLDDIWTGIIDAINSVFPGLGDLIVAPLQSALDAAIGVITGWVDIVLGVFDLIFAFFRGDFGAVGDAINKIIEGVSQVVGAILNVLIIDPLNLILNSLQLAINLIRNAELFGIFPFKGLPDPSAWTLDRFQGGGFVGGRPIPILAEEGELILNAAQQRGAAAAITNNNSRDQNITVFVTVMGGLGRDGVGLGNEISENVNRELQARGTLNL
ncbi:MAG: hypothetical protein V3U54_12965 [Thermodesulfobacteriota bacterium]